MFIRCGIIMTEIITESQIRKNFHTAAGNFKRCLRSIGYKDVKVTYPLDVLENEELKTTFVIDYGEYNPSSINIRMKAKGVWTYIYAPQLPEGRPERIPIPEDAERLYSETGEVIACEQCGCIDFMNEGGEHSCAICCQSKS